MGKETPVLTRKFSGSFHGLLPDQLHPKTSPKKTSPKTLMKNFTKNFAEKLRRKTSPKNFTQKTSPKNFTHKNFTQNFHSKTSPINTCSDKKILRLLSWSITRPKGNFFILVFDCSTCSQRSLKSGISSCFRLIHHVLEFFIIY